GQGALVLNRPDLAGKTGTTNDQRDAWFCGYNHEIATVAWVGFDQVRSMGHAETGARAALPMWITYMRAALQGAAEQPVPRPPGIVTVRIDPDTGLPTGTDNPHATFEIFSVNHMPRQSATAGQTGGQGTGSGNIPEQLFY
ncbi:MAG: peptidase, partial [Gammaproteobacteria bacterium]|nr:peptidase [Gammaproteobacteria bacterium]